MTVGDLVVGTAGGWDDLAIGGPHFIFKVNGLGTEPAWLPFDWDDIAAAAGADVIHTHASAAEGGMLDWDNIWSDAVHSHASNAEGGSVLSPTRVALEAGSLASSPVATAPLRLIETYTGTGAEIATMFYGEFTDARTTQNLSNQVMRFAYIKDAGANQSASAWDAGIVTTGQFNADQATYYGIQSYGPVIATGKTLTTYHAMDIADPTGAGTVTTNIGLYIASLTKGGTNYAIYTGAGTVRLGDSLQLADAANVVLGTTTGSKIGTSTSQKLAFWNSAPAAQQVLATGAGKTVDNVITFLQSIGLCRQS